MTVHSEPFFEGGFATDSHTLDPTSRTVAATALKMLATKRNAPGLRRIGFHAGSLLTTGVLLWLWMDTWLVIPLTLLHGYVLAFLFCAQHETAHRTAFRSRLINDITGHGVAFLLVLPLNSFRAFHWDHHRYTQEAARDPELAIPLPTSSVGLFWLWLGWPNWSSRIVSLFRHAVLAQVSSPWIPPEMRPAIVREARAYVAGYALLLMFSIALQTTVLIWLWLVPLVCGYWFLRPYLLAEHTGCADNGDMFAKTRTMFTNRIARLYAWEMPFHTEHHVYPAVPFHALAKLHEIIEPQLVNTQSGYIVAWRGIFRFLTQQPKQSW